MKKTILIIEDNDDVILYLKAVLKKQYHIIICKDGINGMEKLKANEIDLILLDYMLPNITGCDLIEFLLDIKNVPIIIETAYKSNEVKKECLEKGATNIIFKPIDKNKLLKMIENALSNSK